MTSSQQERKVAYVHTPECTSQGGLSFCPKSIKYDKVDGCKIDLILLPCDEVGLPAQFSPGDRVMGYVYCLLTKALVCTEFKLKLKGEGSCRFDLYVNPFEDDAAPSGGQSPSHSGAVQSWRSKMLSKTFVDSRQMTTHSRKEVYVNTSYDVLKEDLPKTAQRNFSSTDKSQLVYVLEPGEYRFPFSLQLPPKTPPSLIADEAKISYNLSIFLALPHFQNVFKMVSRSIPVICKIFVPAPAHNTRSKKEKITNNKSSSRSRSEAAAVVVSPGAGAPSCEGGEVLQETVIGCCMPDHLDLSVCWDKQEYAPGECLLVTSNLTTTAPKEVAVHGGYVNLIQVATFTAKDGEVKVKENSVVKRDFICHPLIKFPLCIPLNVPPSWPHLQHCSFITLRYIVRFKLYTEFTTMETKWNVGVGPVLIYHTLTASPSSRRRGTSPSDTTVAVKGGSAHNKRHSRHPKGGSTSVDDASNCFDPTSRVTSSTAGQVANTEPSAPPMQLFEEISSDVTSNRNNRRIKKEAKQIKSCSREQSRTENNQNDLNAVTCTIGDTESIEMQDKPPPYEEVMLLDSRQLQNQQMASEMTSLQTTQHVTSPQNQHFSEDEDVAFEGTPFCLSYQENATILRS